MPRKHRILSLVLLALILSQTACGAEQQGTADTDAQTSADDTGTTDETTTVGFEYPDVNYDGAEFRILNFDQLWNMYIMSPDQPQKYCTTGHFRRFVV